jgi:predicted RNA polymerase sigma factor
VLYRIFNEGYATTSGPGLHRVELTIEAIRLTRLLRRQLPDEPEVGGCWP